MPGVSVLTTCYNREGYLGTAIESVLGQSFQDWELVVVDDCSTDGSYEVAQAWSRRDPRIRVFRNNQNLGDYPNRNRAASLATGKYLKYIDSDDAVYPHCLQTMFHMMERYPETGLLACAWSESDPHYPFVLPPQEAYRRHFVRGERFSNSPLTCMYRRSCFEELGRFRTSFPLGADYDMNLRMAARWPVLFAPTGYCFYRVHGGQVVSTATNELHNFTTEGNRIALAGLRSPNCPLPEGERRWATGRVLGLGLRYAIGLGTKKRRPVAAWRLLRLLKPRLTEIPALFSRRVRAVPPEQPAGPDWRDFPAAPAAAATPSMAGLPAVGVLLCGDGGELPEWSRTLDSLRAQWLSPCVVVALLPTQHHLLEPLSAQFPEARVVTSGSGDAWDIRNEWAQETACDLVKFAEPGVLFYPYSLFLEAQNMGGFGQALCGAAGSYGPTLYPELLSPRRAAALDDSSGMCAFRMPLSCIMFRREAFVGRAFDSAEGARASVGFMRRCAAAGGIVAFHEGLSSAHRDASFLKLPEDE